MSRIGMNNRKGFTLLELVFVALILVLLVMSAAPNFSANARRLRLETTAFDLAQLMRYANEMAIARSTEVIWIWDENKRQVYLETAVEDPLLGSVRQPLPDKRARSKKLDDQYELVLTSEDTDVDEVSFFADGTSVPAQWVLLDDEKAYTATVDRYTSQVSLVEGAPAS